MYWKDSERGCTHYDFIVKHFMYQNRYQNIPAVRHTVSSASAAFGPSAAPASVSALLFGAIITLFPASETIEDQEMVSQHNTRVPQWLPTLCTAATATESG